MSSKRYAQVDKEYCVSCGTCTKACPLQAISVPDGISAVVELARCIGCGLSFGYDEPIIYKRIK